MEGGGGGGGGRRRRVTFNYLTLVYINGCRECSYKCFAKTEYEQFLYKGFFEICNLFFLI